MQQLSVPDPPGPQLVIPVPPGAQLGGAPVPPLLDELVEPEDELEPLLDPDDELVVDPDELVEVPEDPVDPLDVAVPLVPPPSPSPPELDPEALLDPDEDPFDDPPLDADEELELLPSGLEVSAEASSPRLSLIVQSESSTGQPASTMGSASTATTSEDACIRTSP